LAETVPGANFALLPDAAVKKLARPDSRRAIVVCRSPERGASYHSRAFGELAEKLKTLEAGHPGFRFRLTGSAVVISRNLGQMISDLASSLGLASIVIFVTLTLAFRSLRIGLICLIPNALPLLLTASVLVWAGEPLRFSGVIVFCVCLGVAVDDTIHVVNRFRRELQIVGDVDEALRRSVQAVGSALVITTLVLLVGFSITLTSAIPSNRMFGALSCCAIGSALLGDLVVLPAMLSCFAKRL
jgi:predicted RND superfamily exporter protein